MFPNKSQFSHHPRSVFGPVNAPSNVAPGQELPRQVPVTPTLQTPAASWTPYPSVPHMDAPAHLSLPPLPLPPLPQTPLQHAAMTVQQLLETDIHKISLENMDLGQQTFQLFQLQQENRILFQFKEALRLLKMQKSSQAQECSNTNVPLPSIPALPFLFNEPSNIPTTSTVSPPQLSYQPPVHNFQSSRITNFPPLNNCLASVPENFKSPLQQHIRMDTPSTSSAPPPPPTFQSFANFPPTSHQATTPENFNGPSNIPSTSTAPPPQLSYQPPVHNVESCRITNFPVLNNCLASTPRNFNGAYCSSNISTTSTTPSTAGTFQSPLPAVDCSVFNFPLLGNPPLSHNAAPTPAPPPAPLPLLDSVELIKLLQLTTIQNVSGTPHGTNAAIPTPSPPTQSQQIPIQTTNHLPPIVNIPRNSFQEVDPHPSNGTLLPLNMPSTSTFQPRIQNTLNSPSVHVLQTTKSPNIVFRISNRSPHFPLAPIPASSVNINASPAVSNKKVPKRAQKKTSTGKENQEGEPKRGRGRPPGSINGQGVNYDRDKARRQKNKEKQLLEKQKLALAQHHPAPSTSPTRGRKRLSSSSPEPNEDVPDKEARWDVWLTTHPPPLARNLNGDQEKECSEGTHEELAAEIQEPMEVESEEPAEGCAEVEEEEVKEEKEEEEEEEQEEGGEEEVVVEKEEVVVVVEEVEEEEEKKEEGEEEVVVEEEVEEEEQRQTVAEFLRSRENRSYILHLFVFDQGKGVQGKVQILKDDHTPPGFIEEGVVEEIFHSTILLIESLHFTEILFQCHLDNHIELSKQLTNHIYQRLSSNEEFRMRADTVIWDCPSQEELPNFLSVCPLEPFPKTYMPRGRSRQLVRIHLDVERFMFNTGREENDGVESNADEGEMQQEEDEFLEESQSSEDAGEKTVEEENEPRKNPLDEALKRIQEEGEQEFFEQYQKNCTFLKLELLKNGTGKVLLQTSPGGRNPISSKGTTEKCLEKVAHHLIRNSFEKFIILYRHASTIEPCRLLKKAVGKKRNNIRVNKILWAGPNNDGLNRLLSIWNSETVPEVYERNHRQLWFYPTEERGFNEEPVINKRKKVLVKECLRRIEEENVQEEAEDHFGEPEEEGEIMESEEVEEQQEPQERQRPQEPEEKDAGEQIWEEFGLVLLNGEEDSINDTESSNGSSEDGQELEEIQEEGEEEMFDEDEEDNKSWDSHSSTSVKTDEEDSEEVEEAEETEAPEELDEGQEAVDILIPLCAQEIFVREDQLMVETDFSDSFSYPSAGSSNERTSPYESEEEQAVEEMMLDPKREEDEKEDGIRGGDMDFDNFYETHNIEEEDEVAVKEEVFLEKEELVVPKDEGSMEELHLLLSSLPSKVIKIGIDSDESEDQYFVKIFSKGASFFEKFATREQISSVFIDFILQHEFETLEFRFNSEEQEDFSTTIQAISDIVRERIGLLKVRKFRWNCYIKSTEEEIMKMISLLNTATLEEIIIEEKTNFTPKTQFRSLQDPLWWPELRTLKIRSLLQNVPISNFSHIDELELELNSATKVEIENLLNSFRKKDCLRTPAPYFSIKLQLHMTLHFATSQKKNTITANSLNILVYSPAFAGSHSNFLGKLADTLTEKGHNVTYLMPVVMVGKRDECIGVKLTKDVVIVEAGEETREQQKGDVTNDGNLQAYWHAHMTSSNARELGKWFNEALISSCKHFHQQKDVFNQMKSKNFDVAILEPISVCGLGYVKALGIEKVILASSFVFFDAILPYIGEPLDFSSVPGAFCSSGEKMTMAERYENWLVTKEMNAGQEYTFEGEMAAYRKYSGENLPDWRELLPAASLFFVNSNPFLDFPRQVLQKTIPIGGISINSEWIKAQKLTSDWEAILEKKPHNMLISFGSMIKSSHMPEKWRNGLLQAIRQMPDVTFIWKFESDDVSFAKDTPNIHFSKWVPQTALLNDPRLTAFVSHGGLGSTMEIAYSGKPSILIPIFADQIRNANMLARHNGVIHLKKDSIEDVKVIKKAFEDILFDEKYKKNAEKLADILRSQPYSPKDNVIKYTEFLGEHGPFPSMDPYGRHLNYFQRNFLDIYTICGVIYSSAAIVILFSLTRIYCMIRSLFGGKTTKKIE